MEIIIEDGKDSYVEHIEFYITSQSYKKFWCGRVWKERTTRILDDRTLSGKTSYSGAYNLPGQSHAFLHNHIGTYKRKGYAIRVIRQKLEQAFSGVEFEECD